MRTPGIRDSRRAGSALAAAVALVLTGCALATPSDQGSEQARPAPVTLAGAPAHGPAAETGVGAGADQRRVDMPRPVRLRIPAIGLDTRVIPLRLDAGGRLIAPKRFDLVGWNQAGPEPGEAGAAVIAGHVDSRRGPAVFYRLRELRSGHRVHVDLAGGRTVTFTVHRAASYPKNRIPDREVYGWTGDRPRLRLITCAGTFDRARGGYRDNLVVFAQ